VRGFKQRSHVIPLGARQRLFQTLQKCQNEPHKVLLPLRQALEHLRAPRRVPGGTWEGRGRRHPGDARPTRARALVNQLLLPPRPTLDLGQNRLDFGLHLRVLDLSGNSIEDAAFLRRGFGALEELSLADNRLRKDDDFLALEHNHVLRRLILARNHFVFTGAFADILQNNRSLLELDLSRNRLVDAAHLIEAAAASRTIKRLDLRHNPDMSFRPAHKRIVYG
jgi:hypothetical protein